MATVNPRIRKSVDNLRPVLNELAGSLRELPADRLKLTHDLEDRQILSKVEEHAARGEDELGSWGLLDLEALASIISYGTAVLDEALPAASPKRRVVSEARAVLEREFRTQALAGWIGELQTLQASIPESHPVWRDASDLLPGLSAEMKRRQEMNGGEPDWRKWTLPALEEEQPAADKEDEHEAAQGVSR